MNLFFVRFVRYNCPFRDHLLFHLSYLPIDDPPGVRFPNYQVSSSLYHVLLTNRVLYATKRITVISSHLSRQQMHSHSAAKHTKRQVQPAFVFVVLLFASASDGDPSVWQPVFLSPKHLLNKCIDNGVTRLLVLRLGLKYRLHLPEL